jgi:hypothetical protein
VLTNRLYSGTIAAGLGPAAREAQVGHDAGQAADRHALELRIPKTLLAFCPAPEAGRRGEDAGSEAAEQSTTTGDASATAHDVRTTSRPNG